MSGTAIDFSKRTYRNARRRVQAKAASYSIVPDDAGTLFTNLGATGGVTFTLPAPDSAWNGVEVEFVAAAAQAITISCAATDKIVTYGDAGADSVVLANSIGVGTRAVCDGTYWYLLPYTAFNGTTTKGVATINT